MENDKRAKSFVVLIVCGLFITTACHSVVNVKFRSDAEQFDDGHESPDAAPDAVKKPAQGSTKESLPGHDDDMPTKPDQQAVPDREEDDIPNPLKVSLQSMTITGTASLASFGNEHMLGRGRLFHTATKVADGRVFFIGGCTGDGACINHTSLLDAVEVFDPQTNKLASVAPMPTGRYGHATVLVKGSPDKLLVIGGCLQSECKIAQTRVAELYDTQTNTWSPRTSMDIQRGYLAATRLANGDVFVTGGRSGPNSVQSTTEVYNLDSDTWIPRETMSVARWRHGVKLLGDGRVLVFGGCSDTHCQADVLASAEIFDPDTNLWTPAASMNINRFDFASVELSNGNLVVLGGVDESGQVLSSVEVYNPLANEWSLLESMKEGRSGHTATLIDGAKIIIAGGIKSNPLSSIEVYDLDHQASQAVSVFKTARYYHTATLLDDGRILFAGGKGRHYTFAINTLETYLPDTDSWQRSALLEASNHTLTTLADGKVLIIGGNAYDGQGGSVQIYDPSDGSMTVGTPPNHGRCDHAANLLPDGRVLVSGGASNLATCNLSRTSVEIFDPETGVWEFTDSLKTKRTQHASIALRDGRIMVMGGRHLSNYEKTVEIYDPKEGAWRSTESMNYSRSMPAVVHLGDGRVLVVGGQGGGEASAEVFDPQDESWVLTHPLNASRSNPSASVLADGRVLVVGGSTSAELYDPGSNAWTLVSPMSESRVNPKSITLHNGKVLVAGGNSGPTIELYDPITDRWTTATTEMSRARQGHELALLNDGKVLIHGGGDTSRELRHDYEIFGLYPSVQLTAVNGVEPYTFEVVSGHANLSQSGVLTPFQLGVVRVRVTDAASDSDEIDVIVE